MATIKSLRIATGKARTEGRSPSHDGEYITVYASDVTDDIIAEHNGGTFDIEADDESEPDLADIQTEARATFVTGDPLKSCGYDAIQEMIQLGWATAAEFDDCQYFPAAAV